MIIVHSKNTVKPGKFPDLLKLVEQLAVETKKEPGCIEYIYAKVHGKDNEYAFIEKWESFEALELHKTLPHFLDLIPKMNEFREPPVVTIYEIVL